MKKGYLTTFQAADILSVTPDSILKWIKSGKLEARRTPGGHYRISTKKIDSLLKESKNSNTQITDIEVQNFKYCWEYNSDQTNCNSDCENCLVYKSQALKCYEMSNLPSELGYLGNFCTSSCEYCDYYKFVNPQN
jgi:excisionase family DNA binding protein